MQPTTFMLLPLSALNYQSDLIVANNAISVNRIALSVNNSALSVNKSALLDNKSAPSVNKSALSDLT